MARAVTGAYSKRKEVEMNGNFYVTKEDLGYYKGNSLTKIFETRQQRVAGLIGGQLKQHRPCSVAG
ncbi:hypothetical protein BDDG_06571 [Blastomyces dermatitidis ATCC 18188]|uniref:Uncharacterized protein n=1 Tax=Ajellomyces dermatitidis (strain ATCC 18188 / CBS 674.68) TaxID=653446 RepID=F2TK64_AJEDA|nr:hypothetical protein BDDG_06571 [Blastomyces dermatitidis ATCC 18188]